MCLAHNTVLCITGPSQNNVMALECEWKLTHFEVSILVEEKLSLLDDTDSLLCLNSVGSYEEKNCWLLYFLNYVLEVASAGKQLSLSSNSLSRYMLLTVIFCISSSFKKIDFLIYSCAH